MSGGPKGMILELFGKLSQRFSTVLRLLSRSFVTFSTLSA